MKHRKPSRAPRAMATTSLPLAAAAAVAILSSGTAGAAPIEQPNVPTTPAQPGTTNDAPAHDGTTGPRDDQRQQDTQRDGQERDGNSQPGVTEPNQPGATTPSQPGVTNPNQNAPKPDQNLASPTQPGVTTPRVAPLPVPGQEDKVQPAGVPDGQHPDNPDRDPNADHLKPGQDPDRTVVAPDRSQDDTQMDTLRGQQGGNNADQQARWTSPSLDSAPAAPVVQMNGPHSEAGANIDGGALLPGYVANTHHFSNLDGYVGTVGYSTPNGVGDAGVSLEFVEANKIKVTSYTHVTGFDDLKSENYVDTTAPNAAKAAVEGWIKQQPGGAAALDAAGRIGRLPEGDIAPQTVNVAGATTQWGGTVQY